MTTKNVLFSRSRLFGRRLAGGLALGCALAAPAGFAQLYSQNFDSTTTGAVPTGWLVATNGQSWETQVLSGSDKVYKSLGQTGGPEVSYYNGAAWDTGYTYTSSVRLYGTGSGNEVGVVYYFKDINNFYEVELNPAQPTGAVRLIEHIGSAAGTVAATGTFASTGGGNWMTVAIVRSGTTTTVKINGTTVITRTQAGLTGGGKIGFTDRFASGWFNNVVVTDTAAPTVAMTAPPDNSAASGTITVSATASDNIGVAGVKFYYDTSNLIGSEVTTSPYNVALNTLPLSNAQHVLTAVARDAAGNTTTTVPGRFINVNNSSLPTPWVSQDIGSTGGSATYNSGTQQYTVLGAGSDIWNSADSFYYVSQPVTNDYTIMAQVSSQQNTDQWAKSGVMFRDTTAAGSRYVGVYVTPAHGLLFEWRDTANGPANQIPPIANIAAPRWLRLERAGSLFTASYSSDGINWTVAGSHSVTLNATVSVGLAVCAHTTTGALNTSVFDHVLVAAGAGGDGTGYNPNFPRLGFYAIAGAGSGGQSYNTAIQAVLAKFHVVIINGSWESWADSRGYTREDVVHGIKTLSTIQTKVFQYLLLEAAKDAPPTPATPSWNAIVEHNNWWLRDPVSGNRVLSPFGNGFWAVNPTQFSPDDDVDHRRPYEWGANFAYDLFVNPGGSYASGQAAPSLDGMYLDNVFPYAKATGDWDRDHVASDPDDFGYNSSTNAYGAAAAGWWRAGQLDWFTTIRTLMPNKLQMGNTAEFANIARPAMTDLSALGVLNQALNGGLLEPAIGKAAAPETWGGPDYTGFMLQYYHYTMNALAAPKLLVFEHRMALNGSDETDATPFRAARYGLACCLMDNGYFDPNSDNNSTHLPVDTRWFEEMSVYQGVGQAFGSANVNPGLGYLGQPVAGANGAPQTTARWAKGSKGVWVREFQNGIVIMNPKANGVQTITTTDLGGTTLWKRISGSQPYNDGTNVTASFTLAERDAIVLLRR